MKNFLLRTPSKRLAGAKCAIRIRFTVFTVVGRMLATIAKNGYRTHRYRESSNLSLNRLRCSINDSKPDRQVSPW